jgi:hypothetical protein
VKVSSKPKSTHIGCYLAAKKCSTLSQQNDYKFAELLRCSIGIVAQQILSYISYEEC